MTYIDLINAFERWLETNYLPVSSQLLWYKLISLFNRCGWSEWVTVDNHRLMSMMQIKNEKTFIKCRDFLIESKFFFYKKGKKGSPNQYKINTVNFTANNTVYSTVKNTVYATDIKRQDIYFILLNKYKGKIQENLNRKIQIIGEMQKTSDYELLNEDEQKRIFIDLMSVKKE